MNGVKKTGIHYVRYRYREGKTPHEGMKKLHGTWRVYYNGGWVAPKIGVYHYATLADAKAAVKEWMGR